MEEAITRPSIVRQPAHVTDEDGELHQVRGGAFNAFQRGREIAECLFRLCLHVVSTDNRTVTINTGLSGDEDHTAAADIDHVGVAGRLRKSRRVQVADDNTDNLHKDLKFERGKSQATACGSRRSSGVSSLTFGKLDQDSRHLHSRAE